LRNIDAYSLRKSTSVNGTQEFEKS